MTKLFIGLFVLSLLNGCSGCRYSNLADYYKKNQALHHEIADSLHNFISNYSTEVTMRQKFYDEKSVSFGYYFADINTVIGIGFDSSLKRENPYPERTEKINIPIKLIKDFKKTIYHAITATDEGIFFGYKYYSNSDYEYGVLVYYDENKIIKDNVIERLGNGVCVYKAVIP